MTPRNTETNFWQKVKKLPSGCWIWTGYVTGTGYGRFFINGGQVFAHRWIYEQRHGPIPRPLTIDHLCRRPLCVNPKHMEVVTTRENTLRGIGPSAVNALKRWCPRGHLYDEQNTRRNTGGGRYCLACNKIRKRRFHQNHRATENERRRLCRAKHGH